MGSISLFFLVLFVEFATKKDTSNCYNSRSIDDLVYVKANHCAGIGGLYEFAIFCMLGDNWFIVTSPFTIALWSFSGVGYWAKTC
jgi:hypothetical protein